MTRAELAAELLDGCTEEAIVDHRIIAEAIKGGASWDELQQMPELNRWPESYIWVKCRMDDIDE